MNLISATHIYELTFNTQIHHKNFLTLKVSKKLLFNTKKYKLWQKIMWLNRIH